MGQPWLLRYISELVIWVNNFAFYIFSKLYLMITVKKVCDMQKRTWAFRAWHILNSHTQTSLHCRLVWVCDFSLIAYLRSSTEMTLWRSTMNEYCSLLHVDGRPTAHACRTERHLSFRLFNKVAICYRILARVAERSESHKMCHSRNLRVMN